MKYQAEAFGSFFPGPYLVLRVDYLRNFEYKGCRYYSTRGKRNGKFHCGTVIKKVDRISSIFILAFQRLNIA